MMMLAPATEPVIVPANWALVRAGVCSLFVVVIGVIVGVEGKGVEDEGEDVVVE